MADFFINISEVVSSIQKMDSVIAVQNEISKTIDNISSEIQSVGLNDIGPCLTRLVFLLNKSAKKLDTIQRAGMDVVKRYQNADLNIMNKNMDWEDVWEWIKQRGEAAKEIWDDVQEHIDGYIDSFLQYVDDIVLTKEEREELEQQINDLVAPYTYIDAYGVERVDVSAMSQQEKEALVAAYETLYPSYGSNMDNCLEKLATDGYSQEILDIKAIAYTAPEPYRTTFLENVGDLKVVDTNYSGTDCCSGNELHLNLQNWTNPNRKYSTFFHEAAHGLDNLLGDGNKPYTQTYNDGALDEALQMDLKNEINSQLDPIIANYNLSPTDEAIVRQRIIDEIMDCPDSTYYYPQLGDCNFFGRHILSSDDMQNIFDLTVSGVQGDVEASASDVFGGYTGNLCAHVNNNGTPLNCHPAVTIDANGEYSSYWRYNDSGSSTSFEAGDYTHLQEMEAWAENYSAQMTGDTFDTDAINEYMPNGRDTMEEMMEAVQ